MVRETHKSLMLFQAHRFSVRGFQKTTARTDCKAEVRDLIATRKWTASQIAQKAKLKTTTKNRQHFKTLNLPVQFHKVQTTSP